MASFSASSRNLLLLVKYRGCHVLFPHKTLATFPIAKMYDKQEPGIYLLSAVSDRYRICLRINVSSNSFIDFSSMNRSEI